MLTSRSGTQGNAASSKPQSVEVVRRRARHRLIGAAVLVLLGVLGFPLLFDTEPRPVSGDVPIEIPARGEVSSLAKPQSEPAPVVTAPAPAAVPKDAAVTTKDSLDASEVVDDAPASKVASKPVADPVAKTPAKEVASSVSDSTKANSAKDAQLAADKAKAKAKAEAAAADAARAKALLENKSVASKAPASQPAAGDTRLVVQVGAFAESKSAQATRMKLERAGFKTYTNVADTPSGKLIRVRVGPYSSQAEADKAASKVKALGLPARILAL